MHRSNNWLCAPDAHSAGWSSVGQYRRHEGNISRQTLFNDELQADSVGVVQIDAKQRFKI
tara:strand:- start:141 stop:320 length:180 start_codon:yes stop_codon:yes gene_type:complete